MTNFINQEKKKVGIMTWFHHDNYGGILQVVAMSKVLGDMGYKPIVINYHPRVRTDILPKKVLWFKFLSSVKRRITIKFLKQDIKYTNSEIVKKFEKFRLEHLVISEKKDSSSDLEDLNSELSAFVCGSDQIWSPNNFDPHYFLDFVNDTEKMIAYAPSIGLPKIDNLEIQNSMGALISRFKHLSIREKQGAELIKELTGLDAKVVLDPTMLINSSTWNDITNLTVSEDSGHINNNDLKADYAIVYLLGQNEEYWNTVYTVASKLELQVKIIPVYNDDFNRNGVIKESIGPIEFVKLFSQSKYVFTDSFHGTAFAINFSKDFCVFERFKDTDVINQNSRIYNILDIFGLQNRLFNNLNEPNELTKNIDYKKVNKKLILKRDESIAYFKKTLP